jgi:hypothetical protein
MPNDANPSDSPATLETVVNEPIPTIFFDGVWGIAASDGVVKVNLYQVKFSDHGWRNTKETHYHSFNNPGAFIHQSS